MKKQVSGVYYIENCITGRRYIGSSCNIINRFNRHLFDIRNNKHHNKHLQRSVANHGICNFRFGILEECHPDQLLKREQYYIDISINLYNATMIAGSGGHDAVEKPIYLLDLHGHIIREYKSGAELSRDLDLSIAPYPSFNTPSIVKGQYRIVHIDFYNQQYDTIKSWKPYTCAYKQRKKLYNQGQFTLTKDGKSFKCKTMNEVAKHLDISSQAVSLKLKKTTSFMHKKSGYHILYVKIIL